jgi:hypothetical protein
MIIRITCSCGEVTHLAEPQAQRLKNCPACGASLQKSAIEREAVENLFDSPLYSCRTSLLTAWHFIVGLGLLKAAALLVTVFAPTIETVHPMFIAASLLAASGLWLATGFAFLAHLRWATIAAKLLNAAGALIAILVIATVCAHLIITGPAAFLDPQTWLTAGPMLIIGPLCLWVLLLLEGPYRRKMNRSALNFVKSRAAPIA